MAPADRAYRAALGGRRAGLLALIAALWARLYDPARPVSSLAQLGALAGAFTVAAQRAAALDALAYLDALAGPGGRAIPAGLVGSTASGRVLTEVAGMAPAVYWARTGAGASRGAAALSALALLNSLAASEPYRAANVTVSVTVAADRRFTGRIGRLTRPGACPWCQAIADRGYSEASAGFAAHANCQCVAAPEVRNPR